MVRIDRLLAVVVLVYGSCTLSAVAQDGLRLTDETPSPSDFTRIAALQDAQPTAPAAAQSGSAQGQVQNPATRSQPNVARLGNNRFNSLTRSSFYASPFAVALGAGQGQSRASMSRYFTSASHRRLKNTPEMFGDARRIGPSIGFDPYLLGGTYLQTLDSDYNERQSDFPSAGSYSGLRVSENNMALPQDRFWVIYNHMHNAFAQAGGDLSLDRFTFGFEKTFDNGSSSVEFRLPVVADIAVPSDFLGTTQYSGGNYGNLSVILKRVLLASDTGVLAAGMAIEAPTGSQTGASDSINGPATFTLSPSATYLTPYLGAMKTLDEIWFTHAFMGVEIATSGERLLVSLNNNPSQEFFINKPTNLQLDFGGGVWLITPETDRIGLALSTEWHLTTALSGDDQFTVANSAALPNLFINQQTIRTIMNQTTGVHAQFNNGWSLRTAIAFPYLVSRIFDTEVMVQATKNF